jgi:hypothetical protein
MQGVAGRIRDFAAMAKLSMVIGLFTITIFGIPLGALAMFYGGKAIKQRRETGDSVIGMYIVILFGALEILGSLAFITFMIIGLVSQ